MALLRKLPSAPLVMSQEGLDMAWINPQSGARTDQQCPNARQLPFMAGFVPTEGDSCAWYELKSVLGAGH
jgi:penicillin-binding protein 1B